MSEPFFHEADNVLRVLLAAAEAEYGPRDSRWTILPVEVRDRGPRISLCGMTVTVVVNPFVNNYLPNLFAQIAHEVVHLLNPAPRQTNYLEEGLACIFQDRVTEERFGPLELEYQLSYRVEPYQSAKAFALRLIEIDPAAPRSIRDHAGAWHAARAIDIVAACPAVDLALAKQLTETCRTR